MQFRLIHTLLIFLLLVGCSGSDELTTAAPYPVGISDQEMVVNGVTRKFRIYRPAGADQPIALVMIFHGGGGLGTSVANPGEHPLSVFRTIADAEKFIAVYPEGSLDIQASFGWNDCRSDDSSGAQGDDVTFLKALTDKLSAEFGFDASRIFLTGTSNGALMAYRFAFHHASSFGAVAISAGNLPTLTEPGPCSTGPATGIPIMIAYGTADPAMPASGGCVANLGGQCNRGTVISQQATVDFWLQKNNLTGVVPSSSVFDFNTNDAGNVEKQVFNGAKPMVIFWMDNAGHAVPSKAVFTPPSASSGIQNRDIEFAEEAWNFFKSLL